jgi:hypothetical protein
MMNFGLISFASPWVLLAALTLPAIWLLLRMTPPAVTQMVFPAVRLMANLTPTERTPARTPWWLVALRILIAALVIGGLAEPVWNAQRLNETGPVVVVIDDTWAAAAQWSERVNAARELIESADVRRRAVMLVTTATRAPGEDRAAPVLADARDALGRLSQLQPRPWAKDLGVVATDLAAVEASGGDVFWLADGLDDPQTATFMAGLRRMGNVTVVTAPRADSPVALSQPSRTVSDGGTTRVQLQAKRFAAESAQPAQALTLRASDTSGVVLAETTASFEPGSTTAGATVVLPNELANRIARFDVAGLASAASTALADDRWQQRPVGIFAAAVEGTTAPLLEDGYYLAQALAQSAEVRVGNITDLLARPLSMMAISGGQRLTEDEVKEATTWIENGGLLVRFAGPRLDPAGDNLLPVSVRAAGRNLGGALSWGEPAGLGPFPEKSPFAGLPIPDDVKVQTQILAEPSPDLPDRTWARLSDGTPLITAERRGAGWLVLFHVTATPEWSNLPLSGLFVSMLRTMLDLSQGVTDDNMQTPSMLPPTSLLDGLGRAMPPGPTSAAIASDQFSAAVAGVSTPPGLYGTPRATFALNLGPAVWNAQAINTWPAGTTIAPLDTLQGERDLKPWILMAALALLLADFALSFVLRGLAPSLAVRRAATASILALATFVALGQSNSVVAQTLRPSDVPLDTAIIEGVLQTRLAYVATGSGDMDRIAQSGLGALTRVLAARTSAEMAEPARLDLGIANMNADMLMPYPIVYWRVTPEQALPSSAAISAINEYFRHGGMIIFDAPDNVGALGSDGGSASGRLREILARIDMPPLTPMREDHVLTRSFYLLPGLPGRYANGTVYVERGSTANDGVSSVIVGGQDWAAAWARDESGAALYPVVPGGEQQREFAYRAGVNMVMYALTGNYKADQVHLPAIMQRLTQ